MTFTKIFSFPALTRASLIAFCSASLLACSTVYYSAWEKLGKQKRDLLRDNVVAAKREQVETTKEFKDALTVLRETYSIRGGELEKAYDRLNGKYKDAEAKAGELRDRIEKMNRIANDLFAEWKSEAKSIKTDTFREQSLEDLEETKRRYQGLRSALMKSEERLNPILEQFRDYVLFLKHNLNAQAIGGLQGEARDIEESIDGLIATMQRSIQESDEFLRTLAK